MNQADAALPYAFCSFDSLYLEGWVPRILGEEPKSFVDLFLDLFGKALVILLERAEGEKSHAFRSAITSSMVSCSV